MKIKRRISISTETSMASMSDIAFLLIIFFMISSVFIFNEGLHLTLPDSNAKPTIVSSKNILSIYLFANGNISVNNKIIKGKEIKQILKKAKSKNPKISILIKIKPNVIYSETIKIIDYIQSVKISNFSLKMI